MRYMTPCHCLQASTTLTILTVYQLSSMLSFLPIYPDLQRMTWAGRGAGSTTSCAALCRQRNVLILCSRGCVKNLAACSCKGFHGGTLAQVAQRQHDSDWCEMHCAMLKMQQQQ